MDAKEYVAAFDVVKASFEKSVTEFGLPFEAKETQLREMRACVAEQCGCHCENGNASLWRNWISPACIACRTGERTATFFVSLKCSRHCYFCFNPNQEDYEYWLSHKRDIAGELREAHAAGASFDCLAITGGEPLLFKSDVYAFLDAARELYPQAHVRLYTCGDFLDDACLAELRDRGLDEIRFSVKLDGDEALAPEHARTLDAIERAVAFISDVMVEMPVGPHDGPAMKELLVRLDEMGVRGVNLLEFGFPLCNAEAFAQRGLELRQNPYPILYNYWYAGGLPIAGSETECLELMRFAAERGLRLGVHYCSLDNKNSGQIYQQNKGFLLDKAFASAHGWLHFDEGDYFLKCVKAVGDDASLVLGWALGKGPVAAERDAMSDRVVVSERAAAVERFAENERVAAGEQAVAAEPDMENERVVAVEQATANEASSTAVRFVDYDESTQVVAFPCAWLPDARNAFPTVDFIESLNVVELNGSDTPVVREVDARIVLQ